MDQLEKKKVPLVEAAQRAELLADAVEQGLDPTEELGFELVEQVKTDLMEAVDRRWFLKKALESQVESLKATRDMVTLAIKNREKALRSVQDSTTHAIQSLPGVDFSGSYCKVTLKKCPKSLKHDLPVKSRTISNAIDPEGLSDQARQFIKEEVVYVLDTENLKKLCEFEEFSFARLEQEVTCQFRAK
jgi:hypothetical protein